MNWFVGSIAEAVNSSKTKDALFVVYIEGTDELSNKMTNFMNEEKIRSLLETDQIVAVKLVSGSDAYLQFAQIYQLVPLPSLFFIGKNGMPIAVLTGIIADVNDLFEKITNIIKSYAESNSDESRPSSSKPYNANYQQEIGKKTNDEEKSTVDNEQQNDIKRKLELAQKLLEQKQKEKAEEKSRINKEHEIQRREDGKKLQDLKKKQEDDELKNLKEERLKEKMEEKEARRKILEQIAQDKADRALRFGTVVPTKTEECKKTEVADKVVSTPNKNLITKLQFKSPNGETATEKFKNEDTFLSIREYVKNHILINSGIKDFNLATTFPRREFDVSNYNQTLAELQLIPSAVLLIIPLQNTQTKNSIVTRAADTFHFLALICSGLMKPVLSLAIYFRDVIFRRNTSSTNVDSGAQKRSNEDQIDDNNAAKKRNLSAINKSTNPSASTSTSSVYKRTGTNGGSNIHRLHDNRDSDDENNTWNGNSTQQM